MPKFKVQGKHHLTGKKQTLIYDAENAAAAEKRGWDDGLIVETTVSSDEETSPPEKMKKCPYCAEEIQEKAIKCKHCGEWLDGSHAPKSTAEKIPWYFRTSFIITALCCVGPLALPFIWLRPQMKKEWKIGLTIIILMLSVILYRVVMQSLHNLGEYYKLLDSVSR